MFPATYFAPTYFAPTYWAETGATPPPSVGGATILNQWLFWDEWDLPLIGYNRGIAISPSDTVNFDALGVLCNAIQVGGAGVVRVVFQDGSTVDMTAVAGEIIPVRALRVNLSGTTATLMIALYSL